MHILNCRQEYDNIDNTMTLLKQINKPNLLHPYEQMYRVIHKYLRDFRTLMRNNQDRHGRKEHINR